MRLKTLAAATCVLACAGAIPALAAPPSTPPPAYKYSASLSITVPKGSSAEIASKDKAKPAAMRYSPCTSEQLDQLAFNLKYDAGKGATLQNVYLIFHKDGGFFPLVRQRLTSTSAFFKSYAAATSIGSGDTYTAAEDNLGGMQTEVILGGNLVLEGLPSGVWTITAIVAPAGADFDDPATWSAWDTVPFMLGKPWEGVTGVVCK